MRSKALEYISVVFLYEKTGNRYKLRGPKDANDRIELVPSQRQFLFFLFLFWLNKVKMQSYQAYLINSDLKNILYDLIKKNVCSKNETSGIENILTANIKPCEQAL